MKLVQSCLELYKIGGRINYNAKSSLFAQYESDNNQVFPRINENATYVHIYGKKYYYYLPFPITCTHVRLFGVDRLLKSEYVYTLLRNLFHDSNHHP